MKKYFVYLLSVLFLSSCFSEPEEFTVINPDQEFKIDLNQSLSPEGPHLVIEISSIDEFNCPNVEIVNSLSTTESMVELMIEKFKIPSGCENNSGSVIVDVAKGQNSAFLTNDIYHLIIGADELFQNEGTLSVTEQDFSINLPFTEGIILGKSSIKKIPVNHVWGTLNTSSSSLTFDEFNSGLEAYVRKSQILNSGEYGLFAIDSSDQISFPDFTVTSETVFIFEIVDLNGLKNYITDVRESFPDIELVISLSDGANL